MPTTLAAAGDTWGISGPMFLIAYAVITAAVLTSAIVTRRRLADQPTAGQVGDLTSRPHDVAFLNGGAELAVLSALSAMHLRGTVVSTRGTVAATGRLDPGAADIERAIHFTAGGGSVHRTRLPLHGSVATALGGIEKRLVGAGLLLSAEQRLRIRHVGFWMLAVACLGLLRLLAGIAEARSVGLLMVALFVVIGLAVGLLATAPRRTRYGDRALVGLRSQHHGLSPAMKPDWAVYGPVGAALGIGIFGAGALWASDPAFADELAAQKVTAGGSADGGSFAGGDSGGGGGGCGGGCGGS